MANALMVVGGLFVLYLIGLGLEQHFNKKESKELPEDSK